VRLDNPAPGLRIAQPERGFRYGSEAFWLVGFALEGGVPSRALDMGTGSGIAAFLLASVGVETLGIDLRPEWKPLWERSLEASDASPTLRVRDAAELEGSWPLIVSNPPFFPAGSGPVSADEWRAAARTESTATLKMFVDTARACLAPGGRACFVIPVQRLAEIEGPRRIVRVGERRVLVEFERSPADCVEDVAVKGNTRRVVGWYESVRAKF